MSEEKIESRPDRVVAYVEDQIQTGKHLSLVKWTNLTRPIGHQRDADDFSYESVEYVVARMRARTDEGWCVDLMCWFVPAGVQDSSTKPHGLFVSRS